MSGNDKCAFCNSKQNSKTRDEKVEDNMKRVEANDAFSICMLADSYYHGSNGFQQDQTKAMELFTKAADLGNNKAHWSLGDIYCKGGYLKKAKFHYESSALLGNEIARHNIGLMEFESKT
jgi:TPR repeat protein